MLHCTRNTDSHAAQLSARLGYTDHHVPRRLSFSATKGDQVLTPATRRSGDGRRLQSITDDEVLQQRAVRIPHAAPRRADPASRLDGQRPRGAVLRRQREGGRTSCESEDAAVWMLDPWALNAAVLGDHRVYDTSWVKAAPYLPMLPTVDVEPALPIAVDPPHFTARVAVQRSHFTVFGSKSDGLTHVAKRHARMLAKITIPARSLAHIRVDLATCGIRDTSVFPDLEGLSRQLVRVYTEAN